MSSNFGGMKDEFKLECSEQLEVMEESLLEIKSSGYDRESVGAIFRAVHTIKGSSGMFNIGYLVEFTHSVENILDNIRSEKIVLTPDILNLLLNCKDHLNNLIATAIDDDVELSKDDKKISNELLFEISGYLDDNPYVRMDMPMVQPEQTQKSESKEELEVEVRENEENRDRKFHISLRLSKDLLESGMDPISFFTILEEKAKIYFVRTMTKDIPKIQDLEPTNFYLQVEMDIESSETIDELYGIFDLLKEWGTIKIIPHNASKEEISKWLEELGEQKDEMIKVLSKGGMISPKALPSKSETTVKIDREAVLGKKDSSGEIKKSAIKIKKESTIREPVSTLRVDAKKIDHLINLIGEMVIANANVVQTSTRIKQGDLTESVSVMARMVEEIRESAMQVRMVQVGETFNKLKRIVHNLSYESSKEIDLEIFGGDTELDKTVIEKIGDPLVHLVRNAIDHGIETTEEREKLGKKRAGKVKISAFHYSGNIAIAIEDDGKGIDEEKILKKAIERDLITKEETLRKKEILNLIFMAGFSTAEEVTNISGRGVGMDVVRKNIESLRGSIDIESKKGYGSKFTIQLPLTLAIVDGFLTKTGNTHYVIPLDMIVECIELTKVEKEQLKGEEFINLRGNILPLIRLNEFFNHERRGERENIVVVKYIGQKFGLVVDRLLGEYQTVIKPLGKLFRRLQGVSAATILGSGGVALILDVPGLIQEAIRKDELSHEE